MTKLILTLSVLFLIIGTTSIYAQGCSDAGFCTLSSINTEKQTDSSANYSNTIKSGISYGATDYDIAIWSPYVEWNRKMNNKTVMGIKLTGSHRAGAEAKITGLSDVILTGSYSFTEHFSLMSGVKLPFSDANTSRNGVALPMAYQSSLGTYDVILGGRYVLGQFTLSAAVQQPIIQNNNEFFPEDSEYTKYPITNQYVRSGDVLMRLSYKQIFKNKAEKLYLTYSILPIYHLENDTYTAKDGKTQSHYESEGLTLNINVFANYALNSRNSIELSAGAPAIARDNRPDGLSTFAVTAEYVFVF